MTLPAPAFTRDRLTWLAYSMLAFIGFSQAILGPSMPFLRQELDLNYTQGGFLPAAIASGLILTGLLGGWLSRLIDRRVLFWGGATTLAVSIVLLSFSHSFASVLAAILCMGVGGSLTQAMIQALLSDHHAERRAVAITEANVAASLSTTITPLVLSSLQRMGVSWRAIAFLAVLFLGALVLTFRRVAVPNSAPPAAEKTAQTGRLPLPFWLYWLTLVFMVSMEMSMAVWTTDFFISVVGLSGKDAVLAYGAFPAAMLTGRLAGSRLTRRWPPKSLLIAALSLALVGFPLFWLARSPALNILGLVIMGLGIANQYPLTLSIAVGLAGSQTNQASTRVTLGVGAALLVAPLILGKLADTLGLQNAFGMVLALLVIVIGLIVVNNRLLIQQR
ncbi:MAG: MFS transporter [Chloroflexota bacterium]